MTANKIDGSIMHKIRLSTSSAFYRTVELVFRTVFGFMSLRAGETRVTLDTGIDTLLTQIIHSLQFFVIHVSEYQSLHCIQYLFLRHVWYTDVYVI